MSAALIVCPLCPMHCDDVSMAQLREGRTGCAVADKRMHAILHASQPRGAASDLDTCREWVAEAENIVVSGLAIDLETSRAIAWFARQTGARVEMHGPHALAQDVFVREGWFQTTLGELTARETSMLVIGDAAAYWPRIEERLQQVSSVVRWADSDDLPERVAALRLSLSGRYPQRMGDDLEVGEAVKLFKTAAYTVLLMAPLRESITRSVALWSAITGLLRDQNKVARAAMLSFDSSMTVRSVLAANNNPPRWQYPAKDVSLRIEFSPFADTPLRPARRTVLIGATQGVPAADQRVLPASVPGLHHAGIVIRGDGSVTLPLQSCLRQDHPLPTPADQLRRLIGPSL